MSYESDGYTESETYICSVGCGGQITIKNNGQGALTCCGAPMKKIEE